MGYTTDFTGKFKLNKKLDKELYDYLTKFNQTRRMARKLPKKYGVEGEFYVDGTGFMGQDADKSIIDFNTPPSTQPGLWCKWMPSKDRKHIEWSGEEKFYYYVEWLEYLIKNFLAPNGYILSGKVEYQGEDNDDKGIVVVKDNVVKKYKLGGTL